MSLIKQLKLNTSDDEHSQRKLSHTIINYTYCGYRQRDVRVAKHIPDPVISYEDT